ncbi:acyltransferase family protein [Aerococcaceae bacterium zg-BR9]|uniref:acyltransferase n=1 Tax=Aerococcaceae bacterium zg-1292 TaxID=2774330 RepID=UPI004063BDAD|nr:acyltransferase family protein [Aerococcaceae bacterium zg-BR9]MBF6977942.1 acyltransferase family protein [Aerococcaceae bacterium zg-BR22]
MKKRNSHFELLRIIAMFMIVISHFSYHGTFEQPEITTPTTFFLDVLRIGGKTGSNIFVMISAYYLVKKSFKLDRVLAIVIQTLFYSLIILGLFALFDPQQITERRLFQSIVIFPETYWFVTSYVVLLLIAPLLNYLIESLSQKAYFYTLSALTLFGVVMPTLNMMIPIFDNNILWFIYVYLLIVYIKKYDWFIRVSWKRWTLLLVTTFISLVGVIALYHQWSFFDANKLGETSRFLNQWSIFILTLSLSFMMLARSLQPISIRKINLVAAGMFDVYLIHEHPLSRDLIWNYIDIGDMDTGYEIFFKGLGFTVLLFIGLALISIVTNKVMSRIINYLLHLFHRKKEIVV